MDFIKNPQTIEMKSMSIIAGMDREQDYSTPEGMVIRRMVHTTGDPEVARLAVVHPRAVAAGLMALGPGKCILTDVRMVEAGISSRRLGQLGMNVKCAIDDPEVAAEASRRRETRAMVAMRRLAPYMDGHIVAIGNAPTALFQVIEMIKAGMVHPALVVGTPVGFVGAAESKQVLEELSIPFITLRGTKGGSAVAAAAVNALLYMDGSTGGNRNG
ncbi:hypothetical protein SY88_00570 [Clostridiales bacterium PH28_bin88]|nr:hypothetical protein SY88_00570 [Clostridiales bacterium PH28_bin88]